MVTTAEPASGPDGAETSGRRLTDTLDRRAARAGSTASTDMTRPDDDPVGLALLARLRAPATWSGPPKGLRPQVLAVARAEWT